MVDGTHEFNMRMAFNPATEISFLKPEEQELLYQSMLKMQAAPPLMQALLGHSDIETTMQIYVDASKKIMKRATNDYEKLMKQMFESENQ